MSSPEKRTNRVPWLDGLRGAAATFVVLHHMYLSAFPGFPTNHGPWWLGWLLYGHMAVAVFIVVSGFSLALAPMSNGGRLKGGVSRFLQRRAWRILPPYWAAVIISMFIAAVFLQPELGPAAIGKSLAVHGLLVQDAVGSATPNGALWSIAVEWQIYFVFPLILWLALRSSLPGAVMVTTAVVVLAHEVSGMGAPFDKIGHLTPQFLALFALGVLAVQLGGSDRFAKLRGPVSLVAIAALAGFAVIAATKGSEWTAARFFWMDLLFGLGFAAVLTLMHAGGVAQLRRLLASRAALWLGLFSYSIYLIHDPIVGMLSKYVFGPLGVSQLATFGLTLVVGLPVVLAFCYGFHLLFEAPFLHRRDFGALRTLPVVRILSSGKRRATGEDSGRTIVTTPQPTAGEQPAG